MNKWLHIETEITFNALDHRICTVLQSFDKGRVWAGVESKYLLICVCLAVCLWFLVHIRFMCFFVTGVESKYWLESRRPAQELQTGFKIPEIESSVHVPWKYACTERACVPISWARMRNPRLPREGCTTLKIPLHTLNALVPTWIANPSLRTSTGQWTTYNHVG